MKRKIIEVIVESVDKLRVRSVNKGSRQVVGLIWMEKV
jgi:hypothetical protein